MVGDGTSDSGYTATPGAVERGSLLMQTPNPVCQTFPWSLAAKDQRLQRHPDPQDNYLSDLAHLAVERNCFSRKAPTFAEKCVPLASSFVAEPVSQMVASSITGTLRTTLWGLSLSCPAPSNFFSSSLCRSVLSSPTHKHIAILAQ